MDQLVKSLFPMGIGPERRGLWAVGLHKLYAGTAENRTPVEGERLAVI